MTDTSNPHKRIAKNTLLLYFRMALVMVVSLFTSRILLEALGVVDYGIYNVVAGVIVMFTFLSSALGNASSRFITYALGKGDKEQLRETFNATRMIHIGIAVVILVLSETIGLWFLNAKMNIPAEQMVAANWVYQFTIVTALVTIVSVPYNALIIAHEEMNIYAYVSIFDVLFKLGMVYLVLYYGGNRLILYGALIMVGQFIDRLVYGVYCAYRHPETRFKIVKGFGMYREMLIFSCWSMIGNLAVVCLTQGLNIILNIFFGPVVNAARGIAVQVQGALRSFIVNFQTAINPQIVKTYAMGERERMFSLIFMSTKLTFILFFVFALPVFAETEMILHLWLKVVPPSTAIFTQIILGITLVDSLSNPIVLGVMATGRIRNMQIISESVLLLTLPVGYVSLKMGFAPYVVFAIELIFCFVASIVRIVILRNLVGFPIKKYMQNAVIPCLKVLISGVAIVVVCKYYIGSNDTLRVLGVIVISLITALGCSYLFGLTKAERTKCVMMVKQKIMGR